METESALNHQVPTTNTQALQAQIDRYRWYHVQQVAEGLSTPSFLRGGGYHDLWAMISDVMKGIDFTGKRVLDIGCRDGMFSFQAERQGAREVIGIDNDLSRGAVEFLIPHFGSRVQMYEMNLYDLTPERFGTFDIIIFPGVLYHLRYPVWGLKKIVDCLVPGGTLMIESGMLAEPALEHLDLLYCPVETSPYETTSCTFFNEKGLTTTMRSLHCGLVSSRSLRHVAQQAQPSGIKARYLKPLKQDLQKLLGRAPVAGSNLPSPRVDRYAMVFRQDSNLGLDPTRPYLDDYWNSTHQGHSVA